MSTNRGSGGGDRDALFRRTMERAGNLAAARRRRQRMLVTAPVIVLVLALTAGVLAAVVGTNGTNGNGRLHHLGATGTHGRTTVPSPTTPGASSTTTTATSTPPARNAAVIRGVDPLSFTAVSLQHWWVLGDVPCNGSHCLAILETFDGGHSFSEVSVPPGAAPASNGRIQIRFADSSDGYLIGSQLWATTDDGATWVRQSLTGSVTALEAADGKAFAISCGTNHCSLLDALVGSGVWHAVSLPERLPIGSSLSVVGSRVVVTSGFSQNAPVAFQLSTDGGTTFSVKSTPCIPGLGGHVFAAASGPSDLWAACPTGMMATPFRSSDNGSTWSSAGSHGRSPGFSNGLGVAPVSASTALVWPFEDSGRLALTANGGATYSGVLDRGSSATVVWAGYSDPQRAYAIFSTGPYAGQLWMSSDGGRTWSEVHFTS